MPPEPLPWDRKDFFRERKHSHERPSESSLGPVARWRDSSSHGSRNEFPRWGFVPEFRRPPGPGKQGGWYLYPDEAAHGYPTPRSVDRFPEDNCFRPFGPRGDGKYTRNYRENRSAFTHKDWRGQSWENHHHHSLPPNATVKLHDVNCQKSVDDMPLHASQPHSDTLHISDQHNSKDQSNNPSDVDGLGIGQRVDKENSLGIDWKPLKWSRSGSLTSRGYGFSHSSSSRSIGGESSDTKGELLPQNTTPVESPSGDPFACASSAAPLEETTSVKKPRLGWGEGLAKYEKKKVEDPDENADRCGNKLCANKIELPHSLASNLANRSPRVAGLYECASPATPSSVACSFSPGLVDKATEIDANNFSASSAPGSQTQPEGSSFNLENLELDSIANVNPLLTELLQSEDQSTMDSGFIKSSALNKLMLLKRVVTKALECTESEVDSLENELKSLRSQFSRESSLPASTSALSIDCKEQPHKPLNMITGPLPLIVPPNGDIVVEEVTTCCNNIGEDHVEAEGEDMDSPGTAASKSVEQLSLEKPLSPDEKKNMCTEDMDNVESTNLEANTLVSCSDVERIAGSSGDSNTMIKVSSMSPHVDECPSTNRENNAYDNILASNQETAAKASEVFIKFLPNSDCGSNIVYSIRTLCRENELLVSKKFLRRKQFLRFKERVMSLKYRAFQHLWKEDLHFLSIRKSRAKSQKKLEMSSRILHTRSLKHRPSIRSRVAFPAGSSSLVPTTEIVSFTSNLLSDYQVKIHRDSLKMPALILDKKDKVLSMFISSNGLVEDPCGVEKERALINPWAPEEKEIFIDKLATFGKDFRKIASFLDHKTTADCIEFYYKNHKSECFEKTKKKPESKKLEKSLSANTYLVTSGRRWSKETNVVSLDLLGTASAIAAHIDEGMKSAKMFSGRLGDKKLEGSDCILERSSSYDIEDEREAAAADVLAGICGSLSSEAMSSCITSSVDPGEGCQEWKCQKVCSSTGQPMTSEVTQNTVDDDTCSDESCGEMDPVVWADEEKSLFVQSFLSYGKDFVAISRCVQTKSRDQCKVFYSKVRKCLGLDKTSLGPGGQRTPRNGDANGGESDTEDACVVEACSDKLGSKMDKDLQIPISDKSHDDTNHEAMNSHAEASIFGEDCDPEVKPVNQFPADRPPDNISDVAADGRGVLINGEDEKSARMQEGHNFPMAEVAVAAIASVAPSVLDDAVLDSKAAIEVATEVVGREWQNDEVGNQDAHSAANDLEGPANTGLIQCLSGTVMLNPDHSSLFLKGCLSDLSDQMEVNGNSCHKQLSAVDSVSGTEKGIQSLQDWYLRKCGRTISQTSVAGFSFPPRNKVQAKEAAGSHLPCPSGIEKQCKNDVKLFGQILTEPSVVEKQQPNAQENEEERTCQLSSVSILDRTAFFNHSKNVTSALPMHDGQANHLGPENFPMRRYGFWDGARVQPCYSSLPDSAMLLTKHPAASANYTNECHLNGALFFPSRESCSSNGVAADHQVYRVRDGVQPLRLEMKQRQDVLSELHRNGFEAVSSLQQQGRGAVKMNVVQVESSRSMGVSDPVVALKLSYAKAHVPAATGNGNGNGNIIREEGSLGGQ
ncbi:hypothetical protein Nepgr_001222 [Nepenthes gracilis]|uniref:SANT domain-containing protein n=1 Tax=Nepenthes gracilis TaxID=150966 RepID=A0AAD3P4T5_NEPGR|nr:hypothetical protein Nepgr_001222 [Nepenthes gracilis]